MDSKIESLNLITTYPVKWDMYKILRDFIQNFYDSVSNKEFGERFTFEYKDEILELKCKDVSYNYEWLLHIGASSKTEGKDGATAGYFGEGFKIATLCAMRDFDLKIETSSSNWYIEVIEEEILIDREVKKSMAYRVEILKESSKDTILKLINFKAEYFDEFYRALYSFYYVGNPLIGEKIYDDGIYAIHHRSNEKKPKFYPSSFGNRGDGIIFAAFQARGSLKESLIFCYHEYKDNDRDREFFSSIDTIDIMIRCIRKIPSDIAMNILLLFRKSWYEYPKGKHGYESYYTVIKNLIFRMELDEIVMNKFRLMYPKLLCARKIVSTKKAELNERKYCLVWYKENKEYTLVQDSFKYLGYDSLEEKCAKENILPKINEPSLKEKQYIDTLKECVKEIFQGFFELEKMPSCMVIKNLEASVSGYASISINKEKAKNLYGYKYRYSISRICIKEIYLKENKFETALTVFVHELCHTFGGDKSENFSYALTDALEILLKSVDIVDKYKKLWLNVK